MGIYLSFHLENSGVSPKQWEEAYQGTLEWFNRFPLPLIRIKQLGDEDTKHYAYSRDIISDKNTTEEHWHIIGDEISRRTAESFIMKRYEIKKPFKGNKLKPWKIFYADDEHLQYHDTYMGDNIWSNWSGSKTQGYPYHLALLAIGIYLEKKLAGYGLLLGDFNRSQAEQMINWMEAVSEEQFELPIVTTPVRLWDAIKTAFSSIQPAIIRFLTLSMTDTETAYRLLIAKGHQATLMPILADKLKGYSSLTQYGAIDIWLPFLAATDDVDALIDLVSLANQNKETPFSWVKLLEQLCREYVTLNPIEKENVNVLHPNSDGIETVEDQFTNVFLMLGGMKKKNTKIYIPKEEIWEAFMAKAPQQAAEFKKVLEEHETKSKEKIKDLDETVSEIEKLFSENINDDIIEHQEKEEQLFFNQFEPHEQYIAKQAYSSTIKFGDTKKNFKAIGKQLRNFIKKESTRALPESRKALIEDIYTYSHLSGFALTEQAWKAVEQCENKKILRVLCMFARLKIDGLSNSRWRKHIFESPLGWKYLLAKKDRLA